MKFIIDHKSPLPLHLQVESLLRNLLLEKEYQEGKLLPCEVDIANMLGISRNTVRQAFNKLVLEGILIRKKGKGTRIAEKNIVTNLENWSFSGEMLNKGIDAKDYLLRAAEVSADVDTAKAMDIPVGTKVIQIEKIKGTVKKPIVYFISYFHPRTGVKSDSDFTKPLYRMLEEEYSIFGSVSKEEINAITADKDLSEILQISIGDPILFRKRKVYDPGERLIEYNLGFYRADSFTYSIDVIKGK
jgi:GntR family transcriptional regulator